MTTSAFIGKNPFTGEAATSRKRPPAPEVDVSTLSIADDPLPKYRAPVDTKYGPLFSKLKVGQCIVCEAGTASKIGHALNTWLDKHGKNNMVKTCQKYEKDGKGRVWLLEPRTVAKLKAVG